MIAGGRAVNSNYVRPYVKDGVAVVMSPIGFGHFELYE